MDGRSFALTVAAFVSIGCLVSCGESGELQVAKTSPTQTEPMWKKHKVVAERIYSELGYMCLVTDVTFHDGGRSVHFCTHSPDGFVTVDYVACAATHSAEMSLETFDVVSTDPTRWPPACEVARSVALHAVADASSG